jgi:predicted dehydrogenase
MTNLKFIILGAGGRGQTFSKWLASEVGAGSVIAVADPNVARRNVIAEAHGIPPERCYDTWQDAMAEEKFADVVINTTMDRDHIASATTAMRAGYHMMLEKPMAVTLADCIEIDRVRQETGRYVIVCHSLRYHATYSEIRRILRSGVIGDVLSYDQLEAIEHIHMSHSFVRGNWSREGDSTFILMAKSCHDVDIVVDMVGDDVKSVSSFGELSFFRPENAPAGAPNFCVEGCPAAETCPYESSKLYLNKSYWSFHSGFDLLTPEDAKTALGTSPYGRCVFKAGNDVMDHQVVSMKFAGGATATLTVTAFTPHGGRFVRVHGSKGYLEARIDERKIDYWQFWEGNKKTSIDVPAAEGSHGGADATVMQTLIQAIESGEPNLIQTDTGTSLKTHRVVFCAEQARRENRVVEVSETN